MAFSFSNNPAFSPANLLTLSGNILANPNFGQGLGTGLQQLSANVTAQQKEQAERQRQLQETAQMGNYLRKQSPGVDLSTFTPEMVKMAASTALQKQLNPAAPEFKVLPDGTYGTWDGSKFNVLGQATKPLDPTAIQRDLQAAGLQPGTAEYQKAILDNYRKNGGQDDYANRAAMAEQLGMTKDDPRYQSFVLTGKMPREDAQSLTAVDKKAILEADEMVAVNEGAITALKQAKNVSDQANAGWGSGVRATLGANLPDYVIPDWVSSPESSTATIDFDNAVVGQALTQLKAIFGGAPTEGERKILLDLQGSSNLPKESRDKILDRAIAAAERRLQFNQERARDLRGGTYYKENRADTPATTTDAVKLGPNGEGYDSVPPGGQYIAPDGSVRVKGGQ